MSEILRAKNRIFNHPNEVENPTMGGFQLSKSFHYSQKFNRSQLLMQTPDDHDFSPSRIRQPKKNINVYTEKDCLSEKNSLSRYSENKRLRYVNQERGESPFQIFDLASEHQSYDDVEMHSQKHKKLFHTDRINFMIAQAPIRIAISPYKPKECKREIVENLIKETTRNKSTFTDSLFPPTRAIIFTKKVLYQQQGLKLQSLIRIYQHSQIKILNHCEPTCLVQGKFTSPNLYSALAILAEDPIRIATLFGNQEANEEGIYYVYLCQDGVWRYVLVDDHVPIKIILKKTMLFLHTLDLHGVYEVWPALIEKAIAKMYGTYLDLALAQNGITPIFRILTGLPVSEYNLLKDFRSYIILIDAALKKNQFVILERISQELKETARIRGIDSSLSYRIVDLKKNCVILRNLAEKDFQTKLTFEQALIFTKLIIFRNQNNYSYISHKLRHQKGYFSKIQLRVQKDSKCYLQIWQNNPAYYKHHLGSNIEYEVSPFKIVVRPLELYGESPLETTIEVITSLGKELELEAGVYELCIHLCQKREQDFTLSYYGEHNVELTRQKNMNRWKDYCYCQP